MINKINWPNDKQFAFTIVDDTDRSTVENTKPVYDYLYLKGLRTTKTVWVYESRNKFSGQTILDKDYFDFVKEIQRRGFEIALHNAGSGKFNRAEILSALEKYKKLIGEYPTMQINHADNIDNIYWGSKRFLFPVNFIYSLMRRRYKPLGEVESSDHFWGDFCKEHIKYIRNRTFNDINSLNVDPTMPHYEIGKTKYSNYWFSSCDAATAKEFAEVLSPKHVDKLVQEGGLCIIYTHFFSKYVDEEQNLDRGFIDAIDYMATQNGWFAPATEILDFLLQQKSMPEEETLTLMQTLKLDFRWLFERCFRKID